jgi:glycosyltransferase involved in cell wall biosynthesis
MLSPTVLIFSPGIDGHRQNYCVVIADWFIKSGYHVALALGRADDGAIASETPLIGQLLRKNDTEFIDLGDTLDTSKISGYWVDKLSALENEIKPDCTFIPTGDECRISLAGLGKCIKPAGIQRAAIFIRADHIYKRDMSDMPWKWRVRSTHWRWKNRKEEYRYFRETVFSSLGLDMILSTNPDFIAQTHDPRYFYLPEIYRAWGFEERDTSPQIDDLCKRYSEFLKAHPGKEVILYFGIWQPRRRYEDLLKIALKEPDTIFVGCGRSLPGDNYHASHDKLRRELADQGRIFEVELPFLPENAFFDMLFNSCNFILLPYQHFYNLSGSMIQAASYGKPVLVPSIGYMYSMVRKYHIGMAYRHLDFDDFHKQFSIIKSTWKQYQDNAVEFGEKFDLPSLHKALECAFKIENEQNAQPKGYI